MSDLMQFSVKAGYLCPRCRSIFAEPDHAPGQYPSRTSYETISTTKAFEDMAREGCFICHRLLKSYEKSRHELVELLQFRYQFVRDRPMYAWVEIELRSRDRTSILARKMVSLLHVKDHSSIDPLRTVSGLSTESIECMGFVKQVLRHCDEHHTICDASKPAPGWYPTRLIDVGVDGNVNSGPRLVLTSQASVNGPYLSLSHCWGGVSPLTLTTETLDQFVDGIDLALLPATFLHAFRLSRAIGIRYIWIDSLCIIQNSMKDWEHESATMLQVYQHAYCNIAATDSQNSHQGLFRSRNPKALSAVIRMEGEDPHGTFELCEYSQWPSAIERGPLNNRAWVVQERHISNRILHFAAEQIYWDCYQSLSGEAFPQSPPSPNNERWVTKKNQGPLHILGEDFLYIWNNIVSQYTSSALTFPDKDKIVAIQSMARYLQKSWNIEYCAGLWRKYIEIQLCWGLGDEAERNPPKVLKAPSWSWLSYDGEIDIWLLRNIAKAQLCASVIDVQVRQTADMAGHQSFQGYLSLRCYLSPITLDGNAKRTWYSIENQMLSHRCTISFDYKERQHDDLFFVPIFGVSDSVTGLVVTPSDTGPGSYTRVGVGNLFDNPTVDDTDLLSTNGKENFPCLEFDGKEGHLIRLV